jgi:hypothetical protein
LFLVLGAGHFEADRQGELTLERRHVTMSGPQFQLRVATRAKPGEVIVPAREEIDPGERLRVAAIEPFREPHDRRQDPYGAAQRAVQVPVPFVRFFRSRLSMVSRDQGDDFDLSRIEAP